MKNKIKIIAAVGALTAFAIGTLAQYTPQSREDETLFSAGTVGGSSTAVNYRGQEVTTVITFASISETFTDGSDEGESQIIYTFPEGRILIVGASINATVTNQVGDNFEASANDVYFVGIGTAAAGDDATLASTEQDVIAVSTLDTASDVTGSFTWEADMTSGADSVFDGTASAAALYFNTCVADTSISNDTTVVPSGYITVNWKFLGDD